MHSQLLLFLHLALLNQVNIRISRISSPKIFLIYEYEGVSFHVYDYLTMACILKKLKISSSTNNDKDDKEIKKNTLKQLNMLILDYMLVRYLLKNL